MSFSDSKPVESRVVDDATGDAAGRCACQSINFVLTILSAAFLIWGIDLVMVVSYSILFAFIQKYSNVNHRSTIKKYKKTFYIHRSKVEKKNFCVLN